MAESSSNPGGASDYTPLSLTKILLALFLVINLGLWLAYFWRSEQTSKVIALVNGEPIIMDQLIQRMSQAPEPSVIDDAEIINKNPVLAKLYLDRLIDETLILQAAGDLNITVSDDELARFLVSLESQGVEQLHDKLADDPEIIDKTRRNLLLLKTRMALSRNLGKIGDDELRNYYRQHTEEFTEPAMVDISMIFSRDYQQIREALDKLCGGADFEYTAQACEELSELTHWNHLGWLAKDEVTAGPGIDLFELQPGDVSKIVFSEFGYHLFYINDLKPQTVKPFEQVRNQVYYLVSQQKSDIMLKQWLKKKRAKSKISLYLDDAL